MCSLKKRRSGHAILRQRAIEHGAAYHEPAHSQEDGERFTSGERAPAQKARGDEDTRVERR
jgi:hypothetical protein